MKKERHPTDMFYITVSGARYISETPRRAWRRWRPLWKSGSVNVRVGQLSSAVGAFNLRYDDAVNPLIDIPVLYGYYGLIGTAGLAGAVVHAKRPG